MSSRGAGGSGEQARGEQVRLRRRFRLSDTGFRHVSWTPVERCDCLWGGALAAEIRLDLAAANEYVESHGSFAEFAREHFAADDDAI
jgi:hypothetical protein